MKLPIIKRDFDLYAATTYFSMHHFSQNRDNYHFGDDALFALAGELDWFTALNPSHYNLAALLFIFNEHEKFISFIPTSCKNTFESIFLSFSATNIISQLSPELSDNFLKFQTSFLRAEHLQFCNCEFVFLSKQRYPISLHTFTKNLSLFTLLLSIDTDYIPNQVANLFLSSILFFSDDESQHIGLLLSNFNTRQEQELSHCFLSLFHSHYLEESYLLNASEFLLLTRYPLTLSTIFQSPVFCAEAVKLNLPYLFHFFSPEDVLRTNPDAFL